LKTITKYWFLDGFNLFRKLGKPDMMKICEILEMDNIDKGKSIHLNDKHQNSIFFLKKGSVKIVNTTNNSVKYIVKRGNLFGELALFDKEVAEEEIAYALENCVICYIDAKQMESLMEKHKSLKNGALKVYGLRIKKLERRLNDLLYKDSDIANLTNTSRQTVNNVMSTMRREGELDYNAKFISKTN